MSKLSAHLRLSKRFTGQAVNKVCFVGLLRALRQRKQTRAHWANLLSAELEADSSFLGHANGIFISETAQTMSTEMFSRARTVLARGTCQDVVTLLWHLHIKQSLDDRTGRVDVSDRVLPANNFWSRGPVPASLG